MKFVVVKNNFPIFLVSNYRDLRYLSRAGTPWLRAGPVLPAPEAGDPLSRRPTFSTRGKE